MRILLVQNNNGLSDLWSVFLRRKGIEVICEATQAAAVKRILFEKFDALVLDLILPDGGAIAISDIATYRQPDAPIIAVTNTGLFADGSLFSVMPSIRSLLRTPLRPDDLLAVLEHYVPQFLATDQHEVA